MPFSMRTATYKYVNESKTPERRFYIYIILHSFHRYVDKKVLFVERQYRLSVHVQYLPAFRSKYVFWKRDIFNPERIIPFTRDFLQTARDKNYLTKRDLQGSTKATVAFINELSDPTHVVLSKIQLQKAPSVFLPEFSNFPGIFSKPYFLKKHIYGQLKILKSKPNRSSRFQVTRFQLFIQHRPNNKQTSGP